MPGMSAPETFRHQLLSTIPRLRRYARSLSYDVSAAEVSKLSERA